MVERFLGFNWLGNILWHDRIGNSHDSNSVKAVQTPLSIVLRFKTLQVCLSLLQADESWC